MSILTKYKKTTEYTRVMLLHLLLNGHDLANVDKLEIYEEDRQFNLKERKLYGFTKDFVDVRRLEQEINTVISPRVCDVDTFEDTVNSEIVYQHTPKTEKNGIRINDMDVIDNIMIILPDAVISPKEAKPLTDTEHKGFMFFYDYVINNDSVIGKYHVTYNNEVFDIYYKTKNKQGEDSEICLYHVNCIDKTSTYQRVIYIINKVAPLITEWKADNFTVEEWEQEVQHG